MDDKLIWGIAGFLLAYWMLTTTQRIKVVEVPVEASNHKGLSIVDKSA